MMVPQQKLELLERFRDIRRRPDRLAKILVNDLVWRCQHPVNEGQGSVAFLRAGVLPLVRAMHDVERRDDIFIAGQFRGNLWIAATGNYCGIFSEPLFDIPPTGRIAFLRYGEFYRLAPNNVIVEAITLWDLVGLMGQAGLDPLPPPSGVGLPAPGPASHDGLPAHEPNHGESLLTLKLVEAMLAARAEDDGHGPDSMGQKAFWTPDMNWYGPAGIGSSRRMNGYLETHRRPFLGAFADFAPGNHKARFADGAFCAALGWPGVEASHAGAYLGVEPTGRRVRLRTMEFWRRSGDLLAECWTLSDLPDLLAQLGRDLFADMPRRATGDG